jgi:hypothetical protein
MKKIIIIFIAIGAFVSCDDFQEINTDPNVGVPPAEFLFTKVEKDIASYKVGAETYHENHQKYTWTQYLTQGIGNGAGFETILPGSKYSQFFGNVMPHLDEVRLIMSNLPEEEQKARQKLIGAADVIQAFFALRITDQFGDIPYSEAGQGRHEGFLSPVYDKQEDILNALVGELDNAISLLSANLTNEIGFQQADFIYNGDATKWVKLANAVKLRIATRFIGANETRAREIISSVAADGRLFENNGDQFTWDIGGTYRGGGTFFEWKGLMWSSKPVVDYMKRTVDPRLRIFYELNGYTQATIDAIGVANISPAVDLVNDNTVLYTTAAGEDIYGYRFIGAPADRQDPNSSIQDYYIYSSDPKRVGVGAPMVSSWNTRFIQKCTNRYGNQLPSATGNYVDVMLSYAEVCFMMSEFILKGYTSGSAEDWYNKGVESSLTSHDWIGQRQDLSMAKASTVYPYVPFSGSEINNYMATPEVMFNGSDDLEKVYIQQYLNFFKLPSESWIFSMRTGYPKFGSSLLARSPMDSPEVVLPRRIPAPLPPDQNVANYQSAIQSQGFSGLDESPSTLNGERVWFDQNNPAIGSGGN